LGVVGGMIIVGGLMGLLWRIAGPVPQMHPLRMLLYFVTILAVVDTPEAGVTVVRACHRMLVLGSLIWLCDSRRVRLLAGAGQRVFAFGGRAIIKVKARQAESG
jgi:hypothetical protein